jgi:hypothetical protein
MNILEPNARIAANVIANNHLNHPEETELLLNNFKKYFSLITFGFNHILFEEFVYRLIENKK